MSTVTHHGRGQGTTTIDFETGPPIGTAVDDDYLANEDVPLEFLPEEEADTDGSTHRDREAGSQVSVNAAKTRWDYRGWRGG